MDNKISYKITLKEDAEQLDEVVVVGYGTQKRVNLTGAVSAITNEELVATKSQNAQNMLTGKVPGVRVIQKHLSRVSLPTSLISVVLVLH